MPNIDFNAVISAIVEILIKSLLVPLSVSVAYGVSQIALTKAKSVVASWSDDRRELVFGWIQVLAKAAEKKMSNGELTNTQQAKQWVLKNAQAFLDQHKIKIPLDGLEAMLEWSIAEGLHKASTDENVPDEVADEVQKAFGFGSYTKTAPSGAQIKSRLLYQGEQLQGVNLSGENPDLDYGRDLASGAGSH